MARAPQARRSPPAPVRRRNDSAGTRQRLLAAAAAEFAARGFAGASVDRIARAARVNKAMIYYHFRSKAAVYREILCDMFHAVRLRVDDVASSHDEPEAKIRAFIQAIALEAAARPHFPRIWFREIADGGAHLTPETLVDITSVVGRLVGFITEGVDAGRFRPQNPLLVHSGIVAPLLLFFASGGLIRRLAAAGLPGSTALTREDVVAHVQRVTLQALAEAPVSGAAPAAAPSGDPSAGSGSSRVSSKDESSSRAGAPRESRQPSRARMRERAAPGVGPRRAGKGEPHAH
jgi:TetR/AcrR family transcriptional regulator